MGEQTGDRSGRLSVSLPRCSAAQGQEPRTLVKPERGGRVAAALGVWKEGCMEQWERLTRRWAH